MLKKKKKKTNLHCTAIKVAQEAKQHIVTGSDSSRYFRCSKWSLLWWALRPQGAQGGYACDFRYGVWDSVHLPASDGCLLLWRHLSHWALLMACDTPPDGLSWPKRFAEPTALSKGPGGLSDSCNYTTHSVNHSWENTEQAAVLSQLSYTNTIFDSERACM